MLHTGAQRAVLGRCCDACRSVAGWSRSSWPMRDGGQLLVLVEHLELVRDQGYGPIALPIALKAIWWLRHGLVSREGPGKS